MWRYPRGRHCRYRSCARHDSAEIGSVSTRDGNQNSLTSALACREVWRVIKPYSRMKRQVWKISQTSIVDKIFKIWAFFQRSTRWRNFLKLDWNWQWFCIEILDRLQISSQIWVEFLKTSFFLLIPVLWSLGFYFALW